MYDLKSFSMCMNTLHSLGSSLSAVYDIIVIFTFLCSLHLICIGSSVVESKRGVGAEFVSWLAEHEKHYSSEEELYKRQEIFYDNLRHIESLNQQYKARYAVYST